MEEREQSIRSRIDEAVAAAQRLWKAAAEAQWQMQQERVVREAVGKAREEWESEREEAVQGIIRQTQEV